MGKIRYHEKTNIYAKINYMDHVARVTEVKAKSLAINETLLLKKKRKEKKENNKRDKERENKQKKKKLSI